MVGEVVTLRQTLQWFEDRPLLGKRIVVTRARAQASDLVQRLNQLGAQCRQCPTIEPVPVDDPTALDNAIANLKNYDWIIFTSVNGVAYFFERLFSKQMDARALGHMQTAAIGPATARAMRKQGIIADVLPDTYQAESLVAAFSQTSCRREKDIAAPGAPGKGSTSPGTGPHGSRS